LFYLVHFGYWLLLCCLESVADFNRPAGGVVV
jgi:hypothetical protein